MKNDEADKVLQYATYTVFYINDCFCNAVVDMKSLMKDEDLHGQKIYQSIYNKAKDNMRACNRLFEGYMDFWAEFNASKDEDVDVALKAFLREFENVFHRFLDENVKKYAYVEMLYALYGICADAVKHIVERAMKYHKAIARLNRTTIFTVDMKRRVDSLEKHIVRKISNNVSVDFNKEAKLIASLHALTHALLDVNGYTQHYVNACAEIDKKNNGE